MRVANYFMYENRQTVPVRAGRPFVVNAWEQALLFRNGALIDTLKPGRYRKWGRGYSLRKVDVRPSILIVPTQEVPTSDGTTVKITVSGRMRVADPAAFVLSSQTAMEALYLSVQLALRALVAGMTVEELLADRGDLGARLLAAVGDTSGLGVALEQLDVKDLILPADLKRATAEVLVARAQGLAALERARGETAALRALANAARLAAESPALIQLRLLQELGQSSGHTVVIGAPVVGAIGG